MLNLVGVVDDTLMTDGAKTACVHNSRAQRQQL